MSNELHLKVCTACEGGTPPLPVEEVAKLLGQVDGWQADGNIFIRKDFTCKNFARALKLVNQISQIAETEGHHPDICLHDYKQVTVTLSTHAIGGLSANDFILAAKIDRLER